MHSNNKKQKTIKKVENLYFHTQISNAASFSAGAWWLAKWACTKSQTPKEVPKMPPLTVNGQTANTFEGNIDVLKEAFFPAPPNADLSDLEGYVYLSMQICPLKIIKQEVLAAIRRLKANKASDPVSIPNRILQTCIEKLADILTLLFQACAKQSYHPQAFKIANTIVLKKPSGKADYTIPKGYRPIALLNTLGKALESIMAKKITYLADKFHLLLKTQMGAYWRKSTETALELLTKQVHSV